MLPESLEYLAIKPDGVYIDVTAGLGGHTRAIAERLATGRVLSLDRDAESMELARQNVGRVGESDSVSPSEILGVGRRRGCRGCDRRRWLAGRFGCQPVSVDNAGAGLFAHGRWTRGHADGPEPRSNRGRDSEHGRRAIVGQFDFRVRRGKEVATNSQSNCSRAAHSGHRSFSGGHRGGRAADRTHTSGYAYLHGSQARRQPGIG